LQYNGVINNTFRTINQQVHLLPSMVSTPGSSQNALI
jgi:hypothetical protein